MNQKCAALVRLDWHIKFVCILDQNGKLPVGQSRVVRSTNSSDGDKSTNSSTHISIIETDKQTEVFLKSMYSFYSSYLFWVIRNCIAHPEDQEKKPDSLISGIVNPPYYFEISGCNKDNIKLAVT
ncbi:MAG: hypothetical protein WA941_00585 [Nitrososphaeraceae archaeon]